uniref:Apolipoprotein M n=1 Tax=Stegastes partitus TaxID=144197 RepID=A0A3B5AQX5_9TELE
LLLHLFSVTLLWLMSVGWSAPPACEVLDRSLDQLDSHQLEGRWTSVAISGTLLLAPGEFKVSMTAYFSNSSEPSIHSYTQVNWLDGQCYHKSYTYTIVNGTFTSKLVNFYNLNRAFLYSSCSDCLVTCMVVERDKRETIDLYLLSKRRELEQKEMEEFVTPAECLKLHPPVFMNHTAGVWSRTAGNRSSSSSNQLHL